jgi:RecB family exonuclease
LVYPTTDLKGQDLLRAGFLEDLLQLLTPGALAACHQSYRRLDPALVDQPELAGTPADHRVRALALSSQRGEFKSLRRLAAEPSHRQVLDSAAAAIQIQRLRARGMPFCEYDGLLKDGAAVLAVSTEFGPGYCFSASQLETYIGCPFKFFSKHVLKLKPLDERDELDEDLTDRGSKIHQALDDFERLHDQRPAGSDLDQFINVVMDRVLGAEQTDATDLVLGLKEIERGRLKRTMSHYVLQRYAYAQAGEQQTAPHRFELIFGEEDSDYPMLELAQAGRTVNLRGRIDRIDLVQTPDGPAFRVIDYKSGSVPTSTAVKHGEMVQLPLYAMAVQQLLEGDELVGMFDMGYWSLRDEGFKPLKFERWEDDQAMLVAHVLGLVDQLRRGVFVVQSRTPGCEKYCEYRGVCRLRQVRSAEKNHALNLPVLSTRAARAPRKSVDRSRSAGPGSEPDREREPGLDSQRGSSS